MTTEENTVASMLLDRAEQEARQQPEVAASLVDAYFKLCQAAEIRQRVQRLEGKP